MGRFAGGEALQRGEQERLARTGRDAHQPMGRVLVPAGTVVVVGLQLSTGRAPDGVEHVIQRHARREPVVQGLFPGRQGLERNADIVVARPLIAGQGAGVATDIG